MNERDFKELLKRNTRASMDIRSHKKRQLHQQADTLPPLEDWDLSDQLDRLHKEYVGLRRAHDQLLNSRQLTLSPGGTPIRGAAQISAYYVLRKLVDCSNALDSMVWLLEDSGLLHVARAMEMVR